MFTAETGADIKEFNRSFNKSEIAWEKRQKNIQKHLNKADLAPLYLSNFDIQIRTKILNYVLTLPKEQQKQIVLITGG